MRTPDTGPKGHDVLSICLMVAGLLAIYALLMLCVPGAHAQGAYGGHDSVIVGAGAGAGSSGGHDSVIVGAGSSGTDISGSVNQLCYVTDAPTVTYTQHQPSRGPSVMDVLGAFFLILLGLGGIVAVIIFISSTCERLTELEKRNATYDAAATKESRRARLAAVLGADQRLKGDVLAIFES